MAIVASMNLPWVVILSMVRQRGCTRSRAHILSMLGLVLQAADSRGISQGFQE